MRYVAEVKLTTGEVFTMAEITKIEWREKTVTFYLENIIFHEITLGICGISEIKIKTEAGNERYL